MPLSKAPEFAEDELDGGWGDDEENSSPSATALAPPRVPSFSSTAPARLSLAPLSRPPDVSDDESDWELPVVTRSARELDARVPQVASGERPPQSASEMGAAQPDRPDVDPIVLSTEQVNEPAPVRSLAVSAPAIDITIEPSFPGASPGPEPMNQLSGDADAVPRSARMRSNPPLRVAHEVAVTAAHPPARAGTAQRWLALVSVFALVGGASAAYLEWRRPAIQSLPHLAMPKQPAAAMAAAGPSQPPLEPSGIPVEPSAVAANQPEPDLANQAPKNASVARASGPNRRPHQPIARRRMRSVAAQPAEASIAAPANEPTPPEVANVGVLDHLISAPKAAEPPPQASADRL